MGKDIDEDAEIQYQLGRPSVDDSENMQSDSHDVQNNQISPEHQMNSERKILGSSGEIRSKENKLKAGKSIGNLHQKISIDDLDSPNMMLPRIGGGINQIPKISKDKAKSANKSKKFKLKSIRKLNLDIEAIEEANQREFIGNV